ncbi:hypothetical protein KCU77_g48, partial [Aureobasidium melanogenum]
MPSGGLGGWKACSEVRAELFRRQESQTTSRTYLPCRFLLLVRFLRVCARRQKSHFFSSQLVTRNLKVGVRTTATDLHVSVRLIKLTLDCTTCIIATGQRSTNNLLSTLIKPEHRTSPTF